MLRFDDVFAAVELLSGSFVELVVFFYYAVLFVVIWFAFGYKSVVFLEVALEFVFTKGLIVFVVLGFLGVVF